MMMMMTTIGDETKLDLSRLTDDEARHVWQVVQRDFNLRRKEEDRLGDLKSKIVKEDTKRELLGCQSRLSDSLCIRCLQPFKFLLNTKRQCLDCKLFVCKACSRFNKKEHGWVCDPCQMTRVLKIGTVEWFHENVRTRFKRFGSAKVMKSLYRRLNGERSCSQTDLRDPPEDDTHSMPDVHIGSLCSHEDEHFDGLRREPYRLSIKGKRLLPVDPQDFNVGTDYSIHFHHHSLKNDRPDPEDDWSTVFRQILDRGRAEGKKGILHSSRRSLDKHSYCDECSFPENKMVRARSLSKISHSSAGSTNYPASGKLPYSVEDSEEEDLDNLQNLPYSMALRMESSPDGVPPQITELNKRMSAIESLLHHLEQKLTVSDQPLYLMDQAEHAEDVLSAVDQEERELKKKLEELTENISDKGLSSDEEEANKLTDDTKTLGGSGHYCSSVMRRQTAPIDKNSFPSEVQKSNFDIERPVNSLRNLNSYEVSATASGELSQLESKVALTVASVQSSQSGVTDIQNRIAALSVTGMTAENHWRKAPLASDRRMSQDFPIRARPGTRPLRKLSLM
ncbi:melanophilin isoform X1 [Pygocentrus nattereri]|uniref:RabBD domain-containing protein n=1 Tax=Pygocentrus nattereri TaxID=42514 RepID=A0A3B4CUH3_PYGNA|nr:melanophilin isoform X1 [Pygocentrus nattereri]